MSADREKLREGIARELVRSHPRWLDYKTLALRLLGDRDKDGEVYLACQEKPDLFFVHDEKRIKLTEEGIAEWNRLKAKTLTETRVAEQAVRDYASRLRDLTIPIRSVGPGRRVLERFVHAVAIETDDDLRFPTTLRWSFYRRKAGPIPVIS